jgi:CheY-like chemotaxis protein
VQAPMVASPHVNVLAQPQVLMVETDHDTRVLYREALQSAGYDVEEAVDGREALAKAIGRIPRIVITETHLPFISGWALCALLRSDSATRDVLIVVLTADGSSEDIERAHLAGADAVLVKPCGPDALLTELRRLTSIRVDRCEKAYADAARLGTSVKRPPRSDTRKRSRTYRRFETTRPAQAPPELTCPRCDTPLKYMSSHVGGVTERNSEQWDYYLCRDCGRFRYRQRTRKLHLVR